MKPLSVVLKAATLGLLLSVVPCVAQDAQQLYLLQKSAISSLLAVDTEKLALTETKVLMDDKHAPAAVVTDRDSRLIAIEGAGNYDVNQLVIVQMDSLGSQTLDTEFGARFFCSQPRRLCSFGLVDWKPAPNPPSNVIGLLGLDLATASVVTLPLGDFQTMHTDGEWWPMDTVRYRNTGGIAGFSDLRIKNGKMYVYMLPPVGTITGTVEYDLGVPAPPDLKNVEHLMNIREKGRFVLWVNNDDMLVIARYGPVAKPGTPEFAQLYIYDKKAAAWQMPITFTGSVPSIRGFGPWVTFPEASRKRDPKFLGDYSPTEPKSPGVENRQNALYPDAKLSGRRQIEEFFSGSEYYFAGALHLYNFRTNQNFTIQTGQGDSEIMLIDGSTVYYRVNASLFKAQIGQTGSENPQLIVTDPKVQFAHWAFMGPSLSQ